MCKSKSPVSQNCLLIIGYISVACLFSAREFTSPRFRDDHENVEHKGTSRFTCDLCNRVFKEEWKLKVLISYCFFKGEWILKVSPPVTKLDQWWNDDLFYCTTT